MKPVLHRITVKPDPVEKKTASGIILATNERAEKKATVVGTVVDIGSTAFLSFSSTAAAEGIYPGVRVLYAKYAGAEVEGQELVILNDEDILVVIGDK